MKNIPFSPPDMSEAEARGASEAILSGWITTGPKTKEFEKKITAYCGSAGAVCLNSATAALELILRVLGIGPGDEVLVSAYTYTASASPICHVGATPVMVDTAPESFEMDYDALAAAITSHTKAIIPVDIGGVVCDYDRIFSIAEQTRAGFVPANDLQKAIGRVAVVADCAHAFGARRNGVSAGNIADFSSFSFHAVKNLTTAEGGAATWRAIPGVSDAELYHQFQLLSLHGQSKDALAKTQLGAWEYDIVYPAYKCNMTDIMAGIGLAQLERYPAMLERRLQILSAYDAGLHPAGVKTLNHIGEGFASSRHLYLTRIPGITLEQRNEIIIKMAERGIATNVHYKPLPMMTAYKNLGFSIEAFPNAFKQFENEITLPLHSKLSDGDVAYIIENYLDILNLFI